MTEPRFEEKDLAWYQDLLNALRPDNPDEGRIAGGKEGRLIPQPNMDQFMYYYMPDWPGSNKQAAPGMFGRPNVPPYPMDKWTPRSPLERLKQDEWFMEHPAHPGWKHKWAEHFGGADPPPDRIDNTRTLQEITFQQPSYDAPMTGYEHLKREEQMMNDQQYLMDKANKNVNPLELAPSIWALQQLADRRIAKAMKRVRAK